MLFQYLNTRQTLGSSATKHNTGPFRRTKAFIKAKVIPQRLDLVRRFDKAVLWHTDGGWMAPDGYWDNLDWLTYLNTASPIAAKVVSCNSMGVGCCSSAANGKDVSPAQQDKCWEIGDAPSGGDRTTAGSVTGHYYTNQMTIQRGSWSWDRSENKRSDFFSATELLWTLISTTAWNGTLVMNIGPTADGRVPAVFLDRFESIGEWLGINGEAIYGSRPWKAALPAGSEGAKQGGFAGAANTTYFTAGTKNSGCQYAHERSEQQVCASSAVGAVFGVFMTYPPTNVLSLATPHPGKATKATLLTSGGALPCTWAPRTGGGMDITLPPPPLGIVNRTPSFLQRNNVA